MDNLKFAVSRWTSPHPLLLQFLSTVMIPHRFNVSILEEGVVTPWKTIPEGGISDLLADVGGGARIISTQLKLVSGEVSSLIGVVWKYSKQPPSATLEHFPFIIIDKTRYKEDPRVLPLKCDGQTFHLHLPPPTCEGRDALSRLLCVLVGPQNGMLPVWRGYLEEIAIPESNEQKAISLFWDALQKAKRLDYNLWGEESREGEDGDTDFDEEDGRVVGSGEDVDGNGDVDEDEETEDEESDHPEEEEENGNYDEGNEGEGDKDDNIAKGMLNLSVADLLSQDNFKTALMQVMRPKPRYRKGTLRLLAHLYSKIILELHIPEMSSQGKLQSAIVNEIRKHPGFGDFHIPNKHVKLIAVKTLERLLNNYQDKEEVSITRLLDSMTIT